MSRQAVGQRGEEAVWGALAQSLLPCHMASGTRPALPPAATSQGNVRSLLLQASPSTWY